MANARLDTPVQYELGRALALVRDHWHPMPRRMAEQRIRQIIAALDNVVKPYDPEATPQERLAPWHSTDYEVIWRFERVPEGTADTSVGKGAYTYVFVNEPGKHPSPWNDGGLSRKWGKLPYAEDWYFGFATPAQALAWFYSPALHLELHGCNVAVTVWAVPRTDRHVGSAQAIFRPGNGARRVACISVPDFVTIFQEGGFHAPESE